MGKLSKDLVDSIKVKLMANESIRSIAKILKVPKSTVHDLAKKFQFHTTNSPGRKKKLHSHDTTFCITSLATNKVQTAQQLTKLLSEEKGISLSRQTISRALHSGGMKAATRKKKPSISPKTRRND